MQLVILRSSVEVTIGGRSAKCSDGRVKFMEALQLGVKLEAMMRDRSRARRSVRVLSISMRVREH